MNPETQNQFQPIQPPVVEPVVPVAPAPIKPIDKAKNMYDLMDPKRKKYIKIAGILMGVILVLLILSSVAAALRGMKKMTALATPTPSPSATLIPVNTTPSKYATDAGVLKINNDVSNLDQDLNNTNFRDPDLRVPDVRFDQNFAIH